MIITSRVMRALLRKYKYEYFTLEKTYYNEQGIKCYELDFEGNTKVIQIQYINDYENDYIEVIEI